MDTLSTTLKPDFINESSVKFNTSIIEFENGVTQRHPNWLIGKRAYRFSWNLVDNAKEAEIVAFFSNQLGAFKKWSFTDSRVGGTKTFRFLEDELPIERINAKFSNISATVEIAI